MQRTARTQTSCDDLADDAAIVLHGKDETGMVDRRVLDDERVVLNMLAQEPAANQLFGYMVRQPCLKPGFRSVVVDWTIDVAMRYKLSQETLYLAAALLDGYLVACSLQVPANRFQLLGTVCLLIASKLEDTKPLTITNVVVVCAKMYDRSDVVCMEMEVLAALNWSLHIPTAWNFLAWLVSCDDRTSFNVGLLAQYILELVIIEYASLLWAPSQIACAALCIARQHGHVRPVLCNMAADMLLMDGMVEIRPCAFIIFDILVYRSAKLTAVQRKYKDGILVVDGTWEVLARQVKLSWPPGDGDAGMLLQVLEWGLFDDVFFTTDEILTGLAHVCRNL